MFLRVIVFKVVFATLVIGSAVGLAIREGRVSLRGDSANVATRRVFKKYPLPLGLGCAAVAALVAFGDQVLGGRRKGALATYSDEEFVAKFGGSLGSGSDAQ